MGIGRKKVTIIGAGLVAKPVADYFIDRCGYQVIMADLDISRPSEIIAGRPLGRAVSLSADEPEALDSVVKEADIVVSMVPKDLHIHVARSCLRNRKNMVTASYETPEMAALNKEAEKKGILILNELGADPGIDHLGAQMLINEVRQEGGDIVSLKSYGCGLPSLICSQNLLGYKFSWSPRGFLTSSRTNASHIDNGKKVMVPGERLFENFHMVEIHGLGTFEAYPNRDCGDYLKHFALNRDATFYRGSLRFPGYCGIMGGIATLGLLEQDKTETLEGKTCSQFTASLADARPGEGIGCSVARHLNTDEDAGIIRFMEWLGFFDDKPLGMKSGTNQDVLLGLMLKKMMYEPHERDMVIVHIELIARFPDGRKEKRLATMHLDGMPNGDSAMSRAVGLTSAAAARLVLDGKIKAAGVRIPPTLPSLCIPVLEELENLGISFRRKTVAL